MSLELVLSLVLVLSLSRRWGGGGGRGEGNQQRVTSRTDKSEGNQPPNNRHRLIERVNEREMDTGKADNSKDG